MFPEGLNNNRISSRVALGQADGELPGVRRLAPEENLLTSLEEDSAAASEWDNHWNEGVKIAALTSCCSAI